MKLCTSYFARLNKLPSGTVPISICRRAPNWYRGIQFQKLAPSYDILMEYKQSHDTNRYIQRFREEILSHLDREEIYQELMRLSNGNDIALICYEKSDDFCHRHLVAEWLGILFFDGIGEFQL